MHAFQLASECKELQVKMEHQTKLLDAMRTERDAAIAMLRQCGVLFDDKNFTGHVTDMQTLHVQNKELCSTIKQMRVELEQLSDLSVPKGEQDVPAANYVRYMEEEVRKVKADNRLLTEQLQQGQGAGQGKPPTPASARHKRAAQLSPQAQKQPRTPGQAQESGAETKHRDHLIALSNTIAALQREKGELEEREREARRKLEALQHTLKQQEEMVRHS